MATNGEYSSKFFKTIKEVIELQSEAECTIRRNRIISILAVIIMVVSSSPILIQEAKAQTSGGLTDGLIGYWPMDDGSGVTVQDVHGSNDMTNEFPSNVVWTTESVMGDYALDGEIGTIDRLVSVDVGSGHDITTWSLWANRNRESGGSNFWIQNDLSSLDVSKPSLRSLDKDTIRLTYTDTADNVQNVDKLAPHLNQMRHIVISHEPAQNEIRWWVDAVEQSVINDVKNVAMESDWAFYARGTGENPGNTGQSIMDEIGFWDRYLTQDDVELLYNDGQGYPYDEFDLNVITIESMPPAVRPGEIFDVEVNIVDPAGDPVSGEFLSLESDPANVLDGETSDSEGNAVFSISINTNGQYEIIISDSRLAETSDTIFVRDQSTGGPILIHGYDMEDHSASWNDFDNLFAHIYNLSLNSASKILVVGAEDETDWATYYENLVGLISPTPTIEYVKGTSEITNVEFSNYAMVQVSSSEDHRVNTNGPGTEDEDRTALSERSTDLANFVNDGGALFVASQNGKYGWFGEFSQIESDNPGLDENNMEFTDEGLEAGLSEDVEICCWHDHFLEWPAYLDVLAWYEGEVGERAAVIGGAALLVIDLPEEWTKENGITLPTDANMGGVSIEATLDREPTVWTLSHVEEETTAMRLYVTTSNDQFETRSAEVLRTSLGDIQLGGLSHSKGRIAGCWTEDKGDGAGTVSIFWSDKKMKTWKGQSVESGLDGATQCDTASPRDSIFEGAQAIALAWNHDSTSSRFGMYTNEETRGFLGFGGNKNHLRSNLGPVQIKASGQVGVDMLSLTEAKSYDRITARMATQVTGETNTPVESGIVKTLTSPSVSDRVGENLFHDHVITRNDKKSFTAGDIAISARGNVALVYYDAYHDSMVMGTMNSAMTQHQGRHTMFDPPHSIDWVRIKEAGIGSYIGIACSPNGLLTYFETKDGGESWDQQLIVSGLLPSGADSPHFRADIAYDASRNKTIVAYATQNGVNVISKEFIAPMQRSDIDQAATVSGADELATGFMGVDLETHAESTGFAVMMVRLLQITIVLGVIGGAIYISTKRADFTLAVTLALVLTGAMMWRMIVMWLFAVLVMLAVISFVRNVMKGRASI